MFLVVAIIAAFQFFAFAQEQNPDSEAELRYEREVEDDLAGPAEEFVLTDESAESGESHRLAGVKLHALRGQIREAGRAFGISPYLVGGALFVEVYGGGVPKWNDINNFLGGETRGLCQIPVVVGAAFLKKNRPDLIVGMTDAELNKFAVSRLKDPVASVWIAAWYIRMNMPKTQREYFAAAPPSEWDIETIKTAFEFWNKKHIGEWAERFADHIGAVSDIMDSD